MDAKERLRAYLEQRRELGESEYLLDGLSVEDALAALGAIGRGRAGDGPGTGRGRTPSENATASDTPVRNAPSAPSPAPVSGPVSGPVSDAPPRPAPPEPTVEA